MTGARGLLIGVVVLAIGGGLLLWGAGSPFGWLGIAAVAGVLGTGLWGRRIVGIVVVLGAVAAGLQSPPLAGIFGVAFLAIGGLLTIGGAGRWPALGSRFDRTPQQDPWSQLDRGEDPTLHDPRA